MWTPPHSGTLNQPSMGPDPSPGLRASCPPQPDPLATLPAVPWATSQASSSRGTSQTVTFSSYIHECAWMDFVYFELCNLTGSLPPSPADSGVSDVDPSSSSHNSSSDDEQRILLRQQRNSGMPKCRFFSLTFKWCCVTSELQCMHLSPVPHTFYGGCFFSKTA